MSWHVPGLVRPDDTTLERLRALSGRVVGSHQSSATRPAHRRSMAVAGRSQRPGATCPPGSTNERGSIMRTRTGFGLRAIAGASIAVAVALVVATGGSANAADTTTTFSVTSGGLSVSAPASRLLGSAAPTVPISAQLGTVTVT